MTPTSTMTKLYRVLAPGVVAAGSFLWLASAASAAQGDGSAAPNLRKNCRNLPETEVVANAPNQIITSTSFVNISGSSVSFTQGGAAAGCVIVSFGASVFIAQGVMIVRALLDGAESLDGAVDFVAPNSNFSAQAFNFLFPAVAPGTHTVKMQYLSSNGGQATISLFNMDIRHR